MVLCTDNCQKGVEITIIVGFWPFCSTVKCKVKLRLTAFPRPPTAFPNELWSLPVVPSAHYVHAPTCWRITFGSVLGYKNEIEYIKVP